MFPYKFPSCVPIRFLYANVRDQTLILHASLLVSYKRPYLFSTRALIYFLRDFLRDSDPSPYMLPIRLSTRFYTRLKAISTRSNAILTSVPVRFLSSPPRVACHYALPYTLSTLNFSFLLVPARPCTYLRIPTCTYTPWIVHPRSYAFLCVTTSFYEHLRILPGSYPFSERRP